VSTATADLLMQTVTEPERPGHALDEPQRRGGGSFRPPERGARSLGRPERGGQSLGALLAEAFVSERCRCPVCAGPMEHAKCADCGSRVT
jgi:hypothetical protein